MPSSRSFEWVRIQTTNPKIYFLLGFRPLNLKNVDIQNVHTRPFYVDCAFFVSQFRGFRLQCTVHVFFSHFSVDTTYVQVLVILRPTKRIYLV